MIVQRILVLAAATVIALGACTDEQSTAPTADAEATAIPRPEARAAYVTAVSGAVEVEGTAGLQDADPGARIEDGRLIIVPERSQTDVQFGETAIVRIFGPAQAVVRTVAGLSSRPVMEIELQAGALAAHVNPLAESELFRVRSRRALYTVRGTRFYVGTQQSDELVVEEGEVAVMPRSLDVPELLALLPQSAGDVRAALELLRNAAPAFTGGEQAVLNESELERSERLAIQLAEKLRDLEETNDADREGLVEELLVAIRATAAVLPSIAMPGPDPDPAVQEKIASLEGARLLPVPKDPQNRSLVQSESASNLVKFTLRTVPQSAEIYIAGQYVGESVYRGVLRANQSLSIRVTKEGYRERRMQIDRARSEVLTVQLERLPPSISAESFIKAIRADDVGTVRTYVQEGGGLNVRTDDGLPAVVLASGIVPVLNGQTPDLSYHREILRTIVTAGADLEANFVVQGSTFKLLHASVLAGMAGFDVGSLVELLVANGADVDSIVVLEGEELTPLAIAVRWALYTGETQEAVIKTLLEGGSSLDVAISFNDELLTLREIAVQLMEQGELEDPELIRLLRQAGAVS